MKPLTIRDIDSEAGMLKALNDMREEVTGLKALIPQKPYTKSGFVIVPSGRIDYCCECDTEHGYDCPKEPTTGGAAGGFCKREFSFDGKMSGSDGKESTAGERERCCTGCCNYTMNSTGYECFNKGCRCHASKDWEARFDEEFPSSFRRENKDYIEVSSFATPPERIKAFIKEEKEASRREALESQKEVYISREEAYQKGRKEVMKEIRTIYLKTPPGWTHNALNTLLDRLT